MNSVHISKITILLTKCKHALNKHCCTTHTCMPFVQALIRCPHTHHVHLYTRSITYTSLSHTHTRTLSANSRWQHFHKNGLLVCATIGGIIGVGMPPPAPPLPDIGTSGAGSIVPPLVCVKPMEADVCIMLRGTRGCCCCWTVNGLSNLRDTGTGPSPPRILPLVLAPANGFVEPETKNISE